jgi:hypothetical protein
MEAIMSMIDQGPSGKHCFSYCGDEFCDCELAPRYQSLAATPPDTQGAGYGELVERLNATYSVGQGRPRRLRNPDGPEAAEAIQTLTAENFMLAAGACHVEGGLIGDDHGHFDCSLKARIATLEAKLARAREALEPFAKAALGVETFDPDFPADGAALRASFDWYDKVQSEPLKRHSVRRSDLDRANQILTELSEPKP